MKPASGRDHATARNVASYTLVRDTTATMRARTIKTEEGDTMDVNNIPDEILYLGVVILAWIVTAMAWYDNHSDFSEILAVFITTLAMFATGLLFIGIYRLYKIRN